MNSPRRPASRELFYRTSASFFFSSRRRHTRSLCDWSSDVCSSDLDDFRKTVMGLKYVGSVMRLDPGDAELRDDDGPALVNGKAALQAKILDIAAAEDRVLAAEIGRASCRERV